MKKKELLKIISEMKKHHKAIAAHRDSLRELLDTITDTNTSVEVGLDDLESAIDHFSENL